jgi:hypothetical protein
MNLMQSTRVCQIKYNRPIKDGQKTFKGTDIGRISDMNREVRIYYMHNAIDNGIESSRILRNQIKTLCHHGMLKCGSIW